jgi:hypothetical protein
LIERKIPYVSIFGNHDDEGSLPRSSQMALIETLPYSLSKAGPEDIEGVGNYFIEVLARGGSSHSALTIYLLDTHSYSPDERKFKGYDWIKKNQIDWFKQTAQGLKKKHKEYTHIHMDVAFIHIPLPEYRDPEQYIKGEWREPPTAPVYNSGFRDALVEQGVLMVSAGQYVCPESSGAGTLLTHGSATTLMSIAPSPSARRRTQLSGCAMLVVPALVATADTAGSFARSASLILT